MNYVESVEIVEMSYNTGERPVRVLCSDRNTYICKYRYKPISAFKLVCEVIGSSMAQMWKINAPEPAIVNIKRPHISRTLPIPFDIPAVGSCEKPAIDLRWDNADICKASKESLAELLKIMLFDCWVANEDRNENNYNLMYDINTGSFVPIDYGCIFNTATFDFSLSSLTATDTLFKSTLFQQLQRTRYNKEKTISLLYGQYKKDIQSCSIIRECVLDSIPKEWNMPMEVIRLKVEELFSKNWTEKTWEIFSEYYNEI